MYYNFKILTFEWNGTYKTQIAILKIISETGYETAPHQTSDAIQTSILPQNHQTYPGLQIWNDEE